MLFKDMKGQPINRADLIKKIATPGQRTVVYDLTTSSPPAPDGDDDTRPLRDAVIAEAIAIVPGDLGTAEQLSAASATLRQAMTYLDESAAAIRSQIDTAKARAFDENAYADRDWWRRVNSALRFKGRQRQQLQDKYGTVNRQLRGKRSGPVERTREQLFVKAASLLLPKATYDQLWSVVDTMQTNTGSDAS